jgi:heat shock protein HslJ/endonuclease/exonuclease/phosphatase family metal-dependent hydrolase
LIAWGLAGLRAVIVLGVLTATALVAVPRPALADAKLRFFDWNICGAKCNHGDLQKVVGDLRSRIVAFRPHIATLNEVCQSQVVRLEEVLQGSAWPMKHVFSDQRDDQRCQPVNGKRLFGDAVFSAGPLGDKKVVTLPSSKGEHRDILCVDTRLGRDVLACVVHLDADAPKMNARQMNAVARFVNPRAAKGPVVLAGDFNEAPFRLAQLLNPQRGGLFADLTAGKMTRGKKQKIDYILVSRGHFSNFSGGVKGSKYSDHRVLTGSADLRASGGSPNPGSSSTTTTTRASTTTTTTAPPSLRLLGQHWVVEGSDAFIVFHDEGAFDGHTGCNPMSGTFTRRPGKITFTDFDATSESCDKKRTDLERRVRSVLDGEVTYEIEGDTLELDGGADELELRARPKK